MKYQAGWKSVADLRLLRARLGSQNVHSIYNYITAVVRQMVKPVRITSLLYFNTDGNRSYKNVKRMKLTDRDLITDIKEGMR